MARKGKPVRPGSAPALSRSQVRQFDQLAIQTWGVPGVVLMENAGRSAADAIVESFNTIGVPPVRIPSGTGRRPVPPKKVAVVSGTGNNGGDGFVIARHLCLRGDEVAVFVVGDQAKMTPDAAVNLEILRRLQFDLRPRAGEALSGLAGELRHFDLVVDALGGTGITGPLRGDLAVAVEQINAAGRPVAAVDIPTGLDCDTGQAHDPTVKADLTVTMLARKIGFDAPGASDYTGRVVVVDIGVPCK